MSERCTDCDKALTGHSSSERCQSCAAKKKWQDPEYRHKLSKSIKAAWKRGVYDEGFRLKQSEAKKAAHARGIYSSKESRRKKSEAAKKKWQDPEYRRKLSNVHRALWQTSEFRCKMNSLWWENPDYRQRISEGRKMRRQKPEWRKKCSELQKARWQDPEYRHKQETIRRHPEFRYRLSKSIKAARTSGAYDGVFRSPTTIEISITKALDDLGIEHTSQYRPDGYSRIYDEFVPPNILIEINGDYWHNTEEAKKKDTEKAAWAKANGFCLVVIWEHEIKECGAVTLITERILPLL